MPRSAEEILAHADALAERFEEHDPRPEDIEDARALRDVAQAFSRFAASGRELAAAVTVARAEGHSWAAIGAMPGTSGEAARQRYGTAGNGQPKRQPRAGRVPSQPGDLLLTRRRG
jgi:hypothetical protein